MRIRKQCNFSPELRGKYGRRAIDGNRRQRRRAPVGVGPLAWVVVWKILDEHWTGGTLEQSQGGKNDTTLKFAVVRRTKWAPKRKWDPQGPRRARLLGLRPDQADRDRRNPFLLQIVSERAHGARTDGSNWSEEDGVDVVAL